MMRREIFKNIILCNMFVYITFVLFNKTFIQNCLVWRFLKQVVLPTPINQCAEFGISTQHVPAYYNSIKSLFHPQSHQSPRE